MKKKQEEEGSLAFSIPYFIGNPYERLDSNVIYINLSPSYRAPKIYLLLNRMKF
jgi:hypothetical protein